MMRCMRTTGSRTDSQAAHAGPGSQTAGLAQGSGPESSILATQKAINALITSDGTHLAAAVWSYLDLERFWRHMDGPIGCRPRSLLDFRDDVKWGIPEIGLT